MQKKTIENNLKHFVSKLVPISDNEFSESIIFFKRLTLQKGKFFIQQGKVCKQIAYVDSGILRTFYFNENQEDTTSCFCTENNLTTSYKSFILQAKSNLSIQALEPTELLVIDYNDLQQLYVKIPLWQHVGRLVAENEYIVMEKYASVLNNQSAKEKYLRLLEEQPQIIQRVPVQFIASYLGITRETLSRIRKQVTQ